ncbi:type II secretion system minor pseudopilin GspJ [Pseudomonas fontis]|uniref:Type II secretion system protein J n=1 Tax=Pseudomonas fontis TaxID=2942633 RepID=A0ABT5NQ58_9PSED|nr:type II secretion system minor pseudopilin GspJ [Pseudomonas fontis]MDD0972854.1 type II secretion system minor pseudopilin GspJ [Pseudomonas fontis]MDD0990311.1 type II secretion system minor pseudopilin GspJ [Pseudomonas fontis]
MRRPQQGFTLLELLIAMSLFSLIAVACWTLFDGVVRAERANTRVHTQLGELQRAMRIIEQDAVHAVAVALPGGERQAVRVDGSSISWVRGNRRNVRDLARGTQSIVRYRLDGDVLWRDEAPLERANEIVSLPVLQAVSKVSWQVYVDGWQPAMAAVARREAVALPRGLQVQLSLPRYPDVRRVLLLPGSAP